LTDEKRAAMKNVFFHYRGYFVAAIFLLAWPGSLMRVHANPTGGAAAQGMANIIGLGTSQVTINQSSANAFINWQTFNIAAGETTTFNQPSATSVTWNQINDANPSQILGSLNANGYIILQNPSGFYVGGQASINTHGLVMTTASAPALNISSGGPWSFSTPPPLAKIINYGQINIAGGGSAFLIANDVENFGTISAPRGSIGLYAGQSVLVSTSPDGRGLSARVTLPQGSVDNEGNLIADAGSIVARAQFVNQNGLVQANSAQNVNGTIELVASGSQSSLTLGNNSVISARGVPSTGPSPGGFVVLKSDDTFSETANAVINVAGGTGTGGGQSGIVEILCPSANVLPGGSYYAYLINPADIYLASGATTATTQPADTAHANPYANLNVNDLSAYSQIDLLALNNIELSAPWQLTPKSKDLNSVGLSAGNTITVDPGAGIVADAGAIILQATTVNQNGTLQANSIQNARSTIDISASSAVNLGANSVISANGDAAAAGPGGSVTIQAGTLTFDNTSEITADAGNIDLTATTANLNGTLQANSIQQVAGTIEVNATGTIDLGSGSLVEANAGKIALAAATVDLNGTLQADSIQNASGTIDIAVSDAVSLGAGSIMSARGDSTAIAPSSGGSIRIQSDNSFSDQAGSTLNVSGAAQGGNGGQVTISAPQMAALNSSINGQATANYADASLSLDTEDITLNSDGSPVAGQLALNVNSLSSGFSQIHLQAGDNIEVTSPWALTPKAGLFGVLSLLAGNTITVDNGAAIEADAGRIAMSATTVNLNGSVQANSIGTANGAIEIEAGDSLNPGASSVISASGQAGLTTPSPGGFVVLKSDNSFSDTVGSQINVAGGTGAGGGQNGIIEIFGTGVTAGSLQSTYGSPFALFINPDNLTLSTSGTSVAGQNLNLNDLLAYSQICLYDISFNNIVSSQWNGNGPAPAPITLNFFAGNNITLNSTLAVGNNWSINLAAGTLPSSSAPNPGSDGIYLNGSASIQTQNGNITLNAANEVRVGSGAIRTMNKGNIDVTAQYGDVNTGTGINGFSYLTAAPWYSPASSLGGISTFAGGNVTINAGGDVISFPTTTVAQGDPGTGAFGSSQPGNVTINAGGSVYGCYVVMNGTGTIHAGQNIGAIPSSLNPIFDNAALSLAKGSWNLQAQNDIYLQEVRNPNGVFDNKRFISGKVTGGNHLFDYDAQASVSLTAGNGVYITGNELPRPNDPVALLLPPIVIINAGHGGVVLQTPTATDGNPNDVVTLLVSDITLFPSAAQNLQIATTDGGGFNSGNANGSPTALLMSDSGQMHWFNASSGPQPFSETDHAANQLAEKNSSDPVLLNLSGSMENVTLQVSKFARINIDGDMVDCTFFGENLQASGVASKTSISVGGQIFDAGSFNSVTLADVFPSLPAMDFQPLGALPSGIALGSWYLPMAAAIDPGKLPAGSLIGVSLTQLTTDINNARLFPDINAISQNLVFNPTTKTLTAIGSLKGTDYLTALQSANLTVVRYGPDGRPLLDLNPTLANGQPNPDYGHLLTDTISWTPANSANASQIAYLNAISQNAPALGANNGGLVLGGTGTFEVSANSISLGNSDGILSVGSGSVLTRDYSYLSQYITSGADINVAAAYLETPSSVIAALGGGDVQVTGTGEIPDSPLNRNGVGVTMDLGSQELTPFLAAIINHNGQIALGIYTTGGGKVTVKGLGAINVDSSRIGTFNGGDVWVESYTGDVDAGSGGSTFLVPINVFAPFANLSEPLEQVYANGIVAETLRYPSAVPGGATDPGDITVFTPQGDIIANQGGIKQEALNGTTPTKPTVTLTAGTPLVPDDYLNKAGPPLFVGNISLGTVGVIGETVIAQATGTITGLAVSKHNTSITSQSVSSLTVLAGGTANVSVQSSGSGSGITIIGGSGVNANGIGAGATLLGQNVSVNGGAAASTMGTSATATAASQSAANQASAETQQQVASNDGGDDDEKKKKKTGLSRSVGRVTVVLPKAS
jgi:filamentous hemagglutinin family protein